MEAQVLVLDVGMQPIRLVPWQEAIVWVLERIVEVVDEYPDRVIHSPNWSPQMPSVVRFVRPLPRKKAIKFSRQNIYLRDGGRCQYCAQHVARDAYTYDHVVPRTQGGKTEWENVVVSCVPCNQRKGGRTPEQAHMRIRTAPVKPKWLPQGGPFVAYRPGMPEQWRPWLRDQIYWNGTLEQG